MKRTLRVLSPAVAVAAALICREAAAGPDHRTRMAFGVLEVATASAPADTTLYDVGFAFGYNTPTVDAGVTFGGASAPLLTGRRRAITTTPTAGYHVGWRTGREGIIQLFGAARVPLQLRTGAGVGTDTGVAVAVEAGVRLWACSRTDPQLRGWCMGVNLGTRYQRQLTAFQLGPAVLPSSSSLWSFPISFGVALNPDIR